MTIAGRNEVIGMAAAGAPAAKIADHFGRTPQGINKLIKKHHQTGSVKDRNRSGRPRILSTRAKKIVCRKARSMPKI
jgi:transposase